MIVFNDAQTLSYSTNFNYLGNAFNYNNSSKINIRGRIQSDINVDSSDNIYFGIAYVNESGVWIPLGGSTSISTGVTPSLSGNLLLEGGVSYVSLADLSGSDLSQRNYSSLYDIWGEMENIKSRFSDFQEVVLNGYSIGSGRVNKISFPQSIDPRSSQYEIELEIFKTGNLYNLNQKNYETINIDNIFCKYVSNINESFNFTKDKEGIVSYERSLAFDCIDPNFSGNSLIQQIKSFASGIIYNDPSLMASLQQYPLFYEKEGSRFFSESYNTIRGSYSFNETFKGPNLNEHYRWNNSFSISSTNDGSSSISEKGSIIGVRKDILESAFYGMQKIEDSAISRANDFYSGYVGTGICGNNIFLKSKNKVINSSDGIIDYSFEYSDELFSKECYLISRELDFSHSDAGVFTVSEQGSVKSFCQPTNQQKLSSSISYFNLNIKDSIPTRIFDIYSQNAANCACNGSPSQSDLRRISSQSTYSEANGEFSYTYVYRDDCNSLVNSDFYVTKEKHIDDSVHNVYLAITPYNGEISQLQKTSSLASEKQIISVSSIKKGKTIEDYVAVAISQIEVPSNPIFFMNSADYSFDPDNSKLVMNVSYNYNNYRQYNNSNV